MATSKAKKDDRPSRIVIGPVRGSYLHIWEPAAIGESDEKKYSGQFLFSKKSKEGKAIAAQVEAAIEAAIEYGETGNGDRKKIIWPNGHPKKMHNPLRDGDERNQEREEEGKKPDEAYNGMYFVTASSKTQPTVVYKDEGVVCKMEDKADLYSGCFVFVELNFYPFSKGKNNGVAVGLNHILKAKDGDQLGAGGTTADQAFADVDLDDEDDDL